MLLKLVKILLLVTSLEACPVADKVEKMEIVSRKEWGARDPFKVEKFPGIIPFVIIHHSYIPSACFDSESCQKAMRSMQDFHQIERGWNDIGYSFGIGGDGKVYEGRGYNVIGAHAPRYNDKSIGICLIGDWRYELPPENMLSVVKDFLKYSVDNGYLKHNYSLMGHRQVRETECPGQRLYDEIKTWNHYVSKPADHTDLAIPGY